MKTKELLDKILKHGPTRIVIDESGEAVPPSRTTLTPDIIFIRNDQWSLGAPAKFVRPAYELWKDEWQFALLPPRKLLKIEHFLYLMEQTESYLKSTRH
jgi:hypothetical protein